MRSGVCHQPHWKGLDCWPPIWFWESKQIHYNISHMWFVYDEYWCVSVIDGCTTWSWSDCLICLAMKKCKALHQPIKTSVAFSLLSSINQSAIGTLYWVMNSQSEFDCVVYKLSSGISISYEDNSRKLKHWGQIVIYNWSLYINHTTVVSPVLFLRMKCLDKNFLTTITGLLVSFELICQAWWIVILWMQWGLFANRPWKLMVNIILSSLCHQGKCNYQYIVVQTTKRGQLSMKCKPCSILTVLGRVNNIPWQNYMLYILTECVSDFHNNVWRGYS